MNLVDYLAAVIEKELYRSEGLGLEMQEGINAAAQAIAERLEPLEYDDGEPIPGIYRLRLEATP